MKRIANILRLQEIQFQQFFRGGSCQQPILHRRQGGHAPAGLAGNGHTHAVGRDNLAHFLQQNRRAVEIDLQNRFNGRMNGVLLLSFVPFDFDGG